MCQRGQTAGLLTLPLGVVRRRAFSMLARNIAFSHSKLSTVFQCCYRPDAVDVEAAALAKGAGLRRHLSMI